MNSKYQVGQKVAIRKDLVVGGLYETFDDINSLIFTSVMNEDIIENDYVMTIDNIDSNGCIDMYEQSNYDSYTDEMIECVLYM